jgi:ATP-dependent DNA ligase
MDDKLDSRAAVIVDSHCRRSTAIRTAHALALFRSGPSASRFHRACLPTLAHTVPVGVHWAYEIKHDGFRFICWRDDERVRVFSRNGRDWTDRVPLIAEALANLRVKSVTLDGEGVVCRPRFGL